MSSKDEDWMILDWSCLQSDIGPDCMAKLFQIMLNINNDLLCRTLVNVRNLGFVDLGVSACKFCCSRIVVE